MTIDFPPSDLTPAFDFLERRNVTIDGSLMLLPADQSRVWWRFIDLDSTDLVIYAPTEMEDDTVGPAMGDINDPPTVMLFRDVGTFVGNEWWGFAAIATRISIWSVTYKPRFIRRGPTGDFPDV